MAGDVYARIQGSDRLQKHLNQVSEKAVNLQPAFRDIGINQVASTRKNFSEQGRPRWPDPKRKSIGTHKHKNRPTLRITSLLMKSTVAKSTKEKLQMINKLRYAKTQHHGDKKRNIPARPFIRFQKEDVVYAKNRIRDYVLGG